MSAKQSGRAAVAGTWVFAFEQGSAQMRELLGNKGANLAEMTNVLGADRVPGGFTIATSACVEYMRTKEFPAGLNEQIDAALERLERDAGKEFGADDDPLLLSVRSGAPVSMPGMLDTVLNLGLNSSSVEGLARVSGDARFAWDSYRRLVQMFGQVVRGLPADAFEQALADARRAEGVADDSELSEEALSGLTARFLGLFAVHTGEDFPDQPRDQLGQAVGAVFRSWNNDRAVTYRRLNGIPDELGTAVTVQRMVYGNRGADSGSGVAFSRDPTTGAPEPEGDFLLSAQGEDVVAGVRNTEDLTDLARRMPEVHRQLIKDLARLEGHYRDMQDVEYTVEGGRLYILQTRNAKRPAQAAVRFAHDAVAEGMLSREEALHTIDAGTLEALLHPTFDPDAEYDELTRGVAASPGAAGGAIVFSAEEAERSAEAGEDVILVRPFTSADDVGGFQSARGILTSQGGKSSHAAIVARGMGRPCVCGVSELEIDLEAQTARIGATSLRAGDWIAIDGTSGAVTADRVELVESELDERFDAVLGWADEIRRLGVRANADTPADAARARELGAEGIGLCRTEHMFFGPDREELVRDMFIAAARSRQSPGAESELEGALERLGELQRRDCAEIFEAMSGLPVTIRLLDPPMHEFVATESFARELERARESGNAEEVKRVEGRIAAAEELEEVNPMLGTRGVRLGLLVPALYEMQVRAIVAAAVEVGESGEPPAVEIMIPLVAYEAELAQLRRLVVDVATRTAEERGATVRFAVGTMIELPRACLVAGEIAQYADFFSFGTNDLTQTTIGLSRDDAERELLPLYIGRGIFARSPFETIDVAGVGSLVKTAVERGRSAKPALTLGICGEHGGDPASISFFDSAGLDYVSCSPYRVPIARVAAAQAAS
ncbi:MAG TPA: pyruvate, phosphate dikinase [Solirubrobacterales bacterium]|jgi:pyruvate,orthophosphate dikinase|nr:pyruvate, phosphate dikinase [Solirubrobacterales bacterium]